MDEMHMAQKVTKHQVFVHHGGVKPAVVKACRVAAAVAETFII